MALRTASSALPVVAVVVLGTLGAAGSLEVTSPSQGLVVVANSIYTVEWTGTGSGDRYDIDLYYCGSDCAEDDCGDWVTALCPYAELGCPDDKGKYDVLVPEPMAGTSGPGYKVRVMDVADESIAGCSSGFTLAASDEAPSVVASDEPYLQVVAPEDGDVAFAGEEYTVEFDYYNGLGSAADRFAIDLYRADGGSGDCGTYVTSICDKSTIGCRDTEGQYDVTIPEDTPSGEYQIRVGRFEDDELYGCSGAFEVVSDAALTAVHSYSFSFSFEFWF